MNLGAGDWSAQSGARRAGRQVTRVTWLRDLENLNNVEIVAAQFSPDAGPFIVDVPSVRGRVIAVLDGTGSWGAGAAASASVARCLEDTWRVEAPSDPNAIEKDLRRCVSNIPTELTTDEFGYDFSFIAVLLTEDANWITACGWYGVASFSGKSVEPVIRPAAWVEQQIQEGNLTPEEAANHKLRGVFAGSLVAANKPWQMQVVSAAPDKTIAIISMELFRTLLNSSLATQRLSAFQIHELERDAYARNRPVILILARGLTSS